MKKCLVSQKAFCTGQQDDFSPNPQQPSSTSLPSSANLVASWCWNSLWPFASMPMRKKKIIQLEAIRKVREQMPHFTGEVTRNQVLQSLVAKQGPERTPPSAAPPGRA